MKLWVGGIVCLGLVVCATELWANQCQLIDKDQALSAIDRLEVGVTIYNFCEPCGDRNPKPILIRDLGIDAQDQGRFWRVLVNGRNIDLAYIYVKTSIDSSPINLAALANCPASSVNPVLPLFRR
jgi:hypothetical protein